MGKNNTLSEMNLIKDEVGNDHTAKTYHNIIQSTVSIFKKDSFKMF